MLGCCGQACRASKVLRRNGRNRTTTSWGLSKILKTVDGPSLPIRRRQGSFSCGVAATTALRLQRRRCHSALRRSCDPIALHSLSGQSSFSGGRIILDPVNRLPSKPRDPGDLADACGLSQHHLRTLVLFAAIARLAALVGTLVPIGLCMGDASSLRFLGGLGLRLRGRGHEGDQRILDCTPYCFGDTRAFTLALCTELLRQLKQRDFRVELLCLAREL